MSLSSGLHPENLISTYFHTFGTYLCDPIIIHKTRTLRHSYLRHPDTTTYPHRFQEFPTHSRPSYPLFECYYIELHDPRCSRRLTNNIRHSAFAFQHFGLTASCPSAVILSVSHTPHSPILSRILNLVIAPIDYEILQQDSRRLARQPFGLGLGFRLHIIPSDATDNFGTAPTHSDQAKHA